jgi:hypothetical protein
MLHIDGAHSKCTLYDRMLILIVQKLGNGNQVNMGLAHVPVESGLHMVWILLLLLTRGGLDVSYFPIFTGDGNLLAASQILWRHHGILLSIKFCLEHLIQKVVSRYISVTKADTCSVRSIMASMQSSPTINHFVVAANPLWQCLMKILVVPYTKIGSVDSLLRHLHLVRVTNGFDSIKDFLVQLDENIRSRLRCH